MQILKEDTNKRILAAARQEFEQFGYSQSSMRRIAAAAGMTTGNIYRYYKNKEDLFHVLIQPTYLHFTNFILKIQTNVHVFLSATQHTEEHTKLVYQPFYDLILFLEESSIEAKILLTLSEGSPFQNAKQELITIIVQIFEAISYRNKESLSSVEKVVIGVLASTLIEGVCITLKTVDNKEQMRYSILALASTFSEGIKDVI
ncbi:TetR/AcrR family transcriptional regulator [Paenibacillus piscarius]|uniref:TetR/AcrR family transcriptional regulator n=1 Tax=Paenibacillus piscarius TaxID=1089681 RepID=UPI001EE7A6A8|nr:TetR/AcrR family transcriptional regulator [Paenibacillus piscarius]